MEPHPTLEVLREPERVAVLMDPARRPLIEALLERPDSAVGLARRLGDTRQRLNYHLRVLEEAGLVELVEERPRRGVKERVLRVSSRFVVDPATLGGLAAEPAPEGDRFSATYLVALASRAIRELASLLDRARSSGKRLATAGLSVEVRLARPEDFNAFVADLGRAVGEVVSRYHTEAGEGRGFRVIAGTYPAPEREREPREDG
ncbi:MAG: winged helix-turn-helix domain-containing protein [Gemmatimonadota bacterium]|jgi:DNA-binding transcriptional ArsR family regulator